LTSICLDRHIGQMTTDVWAALGDPRRRQVLDLLRASECAVGDLVCALGLTQPSTSKHLRVLREAGLVRVRTDAQRRVYAIEAAGMADLDAWLAPYRHLWNTRLDVLGRHLDNDS
jgi:DNA-binding transcriptional ArsR family regulator